MSTSTSRRPTGGHRLVHLGVRRGGGESVALTAGEAVELAPGITLTIADALGNAMIEITAEQRGRCAVTIDDAPVFEIAHCKPQQLVVVDGEPFVMLAPFAMYVRSDDETKPARLHELLGPEHSPEEMPAPEPASSASRRTPPHAAPSRKAWIGIGAVTVVVLAIMALPSPPAPAPKGEVAVASPGSDRPAAIAAPAQETPPPDVTPAPAMKTAPTSEITVTPAPPSSPPPAARPERHPRAKSANSEAPPRAPSPARRLSSDQEMKARAAIESYQLEGGFDPEAAARKLRALKKELPADAAIQRDVDKALQSIRP